MNEVKAREFFSAYYEGVLEPGLRQAFERRLAADAQLQAEYRQFEHTMRELSDLRLEEIEIPYNLHEVICSRLDKRIYEQKRKAPFGFATYWRNLAFGAVVLAAIVGTVYSLPKVGGGSHSATLVGLPSTPTPAMAGPTIEFRTRGRGVVVEVNTPSDVELTLESEPDGRLLQKSTIHAGEQNITPLENLQPGAAVIGVRMSGEARQRLVALPGTQRSSQSTGEGSLAEFVTAVAGYYREPVLLNVTNTSRIVHWSFTANDAAHAVAIGLADTSLTPEERQGSILTISDR